MAKLRMSRLEIYMDAECAQLIRAHGSDRGDNRRFETASETIAEAVGFSHPDCTRDLVRAGKEYGAGLTGGDRPDRLAQGATICRKRPSIDRDGGHLGVARLESRHQVTIRD